jgi:hypothetical protein
MGRGGRIAPVHGPEAHGGRGRPGPGLPWAGPRPGPAALGPGPGSGSRPMEWGGNNLPSLPLPTPRQFKQLFNSNYLGGHG